MKIAFLINNAYGIGGTIRATANLSSALAHRHSVEIVSVERPTDTPQLTYSPRVRMTGLIDMRKDTPGYEGDHPLTQEPSTMFRYGRPYNRLHEQRIGDWLTHTDADVVIATRPDLNGFLARDGLPRYLRIGQEHLSLDAYADEVAHRQNQAIAHLDAFVTVSEADAQQYRQALPKAASTIVCIPNSVPTPGVEPSDRRSRTIVAAGRLIPIKRYDRLIDAFARICDDHPSWTLRIYGRGPKKQALREQIDRLGLYDRVRLMGAVSPIETEWAKGAIAAVSSDMESFGMTIVEAMHCGVPVVATDCPHGPAEIIDHNVSGLLVPLHTGIEGYAAALSTLMSDEDLRDQLGTTARQAAAVYAPAVLARRYEALLSQLSRQRARTVLNFPAPRCPSLIQRLKDLRHRPKQHREPTLSQPAPVAASRPGAFACAHADGAITIRFDPFTLPPGRLDFVARLRRDPKERQITVPVPDLATAPDIHALTLTIHPEENPLGEGRWDCYVVNRRSGQRHRLTCLLAERSRAVNRPPRTADGEVITALPYATTDKYLAIRAWQRPHHVEVTSIRTSATACYVAADLITSKPTDLQHSSVVAVSRQHESLDFVLPIRPLTTTKFSFQIPHDAVLQRGRTEHDVWDLRLHHGSHPAPIPIGRIAGDIVDRRATDLIPAQQSGSQPRHIKTYFTVSNDLALSSRDAAG